MIEYHAEMTGPTLRERMRRWWEMSKGPLLKDVAELTKKQAQERVSSTKRSPDGVPWKPRSSGGSHPLMVRTGTMLRSIRSRRQSATEYLMGAGAPYAKFHHGTGARSRPFIGVGDSDEREIESLIDRFVELRF